MSDVEQLYEAFRERMAVGEPCCDCKGMEADDWCDCFCHDPEDDDDGE